MIFSPFLQGCGVGLSIAAPVGPIGVLCIRRSLAGGWKMGLATGLGAAVADALYGSLAAFGLQAVGQVLTRYEFFLSLFGGLFLCHLGIQTWRSTPATDPAQAPAASDLAGAFGSTVVLTLANPATLLAFAALCAGFGIGTSIQGAQIPMWIAGVLVGSAAWWLFLSGSVGAFRHTFTPKWMKWVNRISGGIVTAFGIGAVIHAAQIARLRS